MQLAGPFHQETAAFGMTVHAANFPAEIRAPGHAFPLFSSFFPLRRSRHPDPVDSPDVPGRYYPAALKANLDDVPRRGTSSPTRQFTKRNLAKVGYDGSPLDDCSLSAYNVPGPHLDTRQRRLIIRRLPEGCRAGQ